MSAPFAHRSYQIACAYVDGNDANALRHDPMLKLALGHAPLDEGSDLASAPALSRLENAATPLRGGRNDEGVGNAS